MFNTDLKYKSVRAAAILTNSYVECTVLEDCKKYNNLQILANFTIGSLTDAQIKVEFSVDGTTYYQQSFDSISTTTNTLSLGVNKLAATGKYIIAMPINTNYIKISAIGTGTVTDSSLAIGVILGLV